MYGRQTMNNHIKMRLGCKNPHTTTDSQTQNIRSKKTRITEIHDDGRGDPNNKADTTAEKLPTAVFRYITKKHSV